MVERVWSVTSRGNPLLVKVRKLIADAAFARREGLCWIEGEHLCRAALDAGWVPLHALLTDEAWATAGAQALVSQVARVAIVSKSLMATLSALESPSSVAFLMSLPPSPSVQPDRPTLVLDRVQDPGNVGTMLRTAAAFGFKQVIALQGTVALWSPKVLRGGMGAHFSMRLIEHAEASTLLSLTVPWLGTNSHATEVLGQHPLPWPCAWLVGHEGQGVNQKLLERCERVVRIAQPGGEESLNVAVAAAICMHASVQSIDRRESRKKP